MNSRRWWLPFGFFPLQNMKGFRCRICGITENGALTETWSLQRSQANHCILVLFFFQFRFCKGHLEVTEASLIGCYNMDLRLRIVLLKSVWDSKQNNAFLRWYVRFAGCYQSGLGAIHLQGYFTCPDFPTWELHQIVITVPTAAACVCFSWGWCSLSEQAIYCDESQQVCNDVC